MQKSTTGIHTRKNGLALRRELASMVESADRLGDGTRRSAPPTTPIIDMIYGRSVRVPGEEMPLLSVFAPNATQAKFSDAPVHRRMLVCCLTTAGPFGCHPSHPSDPENDSTN